MAIVREGDWVEIKTARLNSGKTKLKGQVFEVLRTDVTTGELTVDTGDIMGQIELLNTDVDLTLPPKDPPPKKSSITSDQILAYVKNLIIKYRENGGRIDTYFLEQILGRQILEQILSRLYMSRKTSFCSEEHGGSFCSESIDLSKANIKEKIPRNKGGKKPGRRNTKPASGWIDIYESKISGKLTCYFCRDFYPRKTKKTKISSGQKAAVEEMIKAGCSAKQIEDFLDGGVIF